MGMRWLVLVVVLTCVACGSVADHNCTPTEILCGNSCVDPLNNNDNCGMCDHRCDLGLICGNGTCSDTCPMGQEICDGTCVDKQTDSDHCGDCTTKCTSDQECRAGDCQVRCDVGLMAPVTDSWGFEWDGLERSAAALDIATTTCAAFGARLPTATELYRVSANQSGTVGMSFHTNPLWSIVPADRLAQITIKLSDASSGEQAATSPLTYRCVCAPPQPPSFSGTRCNGPASAECATVGPYNVDKSDRPALRKSSAVWECANERAHLADLPLLVEGLQGGLPGSGAYIATADHWQYNQSTEIKWTTATGWTFAGNDTAVNIVTPAPFRCAGPSFVAGTHTATVANEYVGPLSGYKGETVDTATTTWAAANDTCFSRGGHIPRAAELAELIQQGLPGGTNVYLWTSDQGGYNGTQFLVETMKWTGLDKRFPYEYLGNANTTATWDYKTGMQASRCIYYPTDPAFIAPTASNGGCFTVPTPVGPSTIYMDSVDRTAASLADAFKTCVADGGHLATERDYIEAIRTGLPNGSNTPVYTSDLAQANVTVVHWTAIETAFTDQYSTYMTWVNPPELHPFRCMWTNELR